MGVGVPPLLASTHSASGSQRLVPGLQSPPPTSDSLEPHAGYLWVNQMVLLSYTSCQRAGTNTHSLIYEVGHSFY